MAKLRGRITQRLAGTRGVLLSMSGYSDEALEGIVQGQPWTCYCSTGRTWKQCSLASCLRRTCRGAALSLPATATSAS